MNEEKPMDPILKLLRQHPREGWKWTLDPMERAWSRGNALALANCSLLAYCDQHDIESNLRAHQFEVIQCKPSPGTADTQAYVAVRSDAIVVAFRGTEPTNLQDFATDFNAGQVPFETKFQVPGWGQVHAGWADGVNAVRTQIEDALRAHENDTRSLWITGHSLGGALAIVAAALLVSPPGHPIAGVYTFGQPRVGDPTFRDRYSATLGDITFRCVNDRDVVPHVPPRELSQTEGVLASPSARGIVELAGAIVENRESTDRYEHAGQLRLLLPEGGVSENLADERAREPGFLAKQRTAPGVFLELAKFLIESPGLLKDHAPISPITRDGYVDRIEALH
jgi:triacylglycerol lipase